MVVVRILTEYLAQELCARDSEKFMGIIFGGRWVRHMGFGATGFG